MRKIIFFFYLFHFLFCFSQNTDERTRLVDSILSYAENTHNPIEERLKAYNKSLWKIVYVDWNRGQEIGKKYYDFSKEAKAKENQARALHFLGFTSMMKGESDTSLIYFTESYQLSKELNDNFLITEALNDLGNLFEKKEDYNKAIQYYEESYKIASKNKITVTEARSLINLANIYELQGNYKLSLITFEQALELCEKHKYNGYLSSVYEQIGKIYLEIKEFNLADKYLNLSYKQTFNAKNYNKRIKALLNLAELDKITNKYDDALVKLNQGLEISNETDAKALLASVYAKRAEIYFLKKELENAIKSIEKSILIYDDLNENERDIDFYLIAGEIYLYQKKYQKAEKYLLGGYEIANKNKNIKGLKVSSKKLYELYKLNGNLSKSYKFLEENIKWKDVERTDNDIKQVLKLELDQEFRYKIVSDSIKKINDIRLIKIQNQRKIDSQNANIKIVVSILITVLILLFLSFYVIHRNRKNRKILQQKNIVIENALEDNELLLKEIYHRVKNNLQIVSSLLHLKMKNVSSKHAKESLLDSKLRINAMLIAHQKMYKGNNYKFIDITEYCRELVNMLRFQCDGPECHFEVKGCEIKASIDQAQSVGFIIHELVTNSIKYAWPDSDDKKILIELTLKANKVTIEYTDNGIGLPKQFSINQSKSFGMNLVNSIVEKQLMGEIIIEKTEGVRFLIRFEIENEKENISV